MLVAVFLLGALGQLMGAVGLSWATCRGLKKSGLGHDLITGFAIGHILESLTITALSCSEFLPRRLLILWFGVKILLFLGFLITKSPRGDLFATLRGHPLPCLWTAALLSAASVPTSNYDAFTAHFAVARLFIEAGQLPLRGDYGYLHELPLAAHMWFLPPLACGLEGGANMASAVFAAALPLLLAREWGARIALASFLVLLSMPQFQLISTNPMPEPAAVFYALFGLARLRRCFRAGARADREILLAGLAWAFMAGLKPPLILFPCAWFAAALWLSRQGKITKKELVGCAVCAAACGGLWYFRNALLHHNPFYPYAFAPETRALIPPEHRPPVGSVTMRTWAGYFQTVFLDPRWRLSLGPWPLILLPLLPWVAKKRGTFAFVAALLVAGYLVTFAFTPFKNRYFIPYLTLLLPWMGAFLARRPRPARWLLALTAGWSVLSFVPYFLQPFAVLAKGQDREAYYAAKFPMYPAVRKLNELPAAGKVLFVATPVYWLEHDHVLSIYSETALDYTRLSDLDEFKQRLKQLGVRYVAYDHDNIYGMQEHPDPWYAARRYQAGRCAALLDALFADPSLRLISKDTGLWLGEITP